MPTLKDESTGVTVSVSDSTATRLGAGWTAEKPAKAPAKAGAKKSDEK